VPAGAQPFDSGELGRGQVFRHTFTVPGTYHYICQPHDWLSMAGVVDVRP
jgi:plastocyanin